MKMLTDKRGPLQGITLDSIVRNAYGPAAQYVQDADVAGMGTIVRGAEELDTVLEMHEVDF